MNSWREGVLALGVVIVVGAALFLYTGQSLGGVETTTSVTVALDPAAAARGEQLVNAQGCLACHTIDGSAGSAPTWKGLAGSMRPLTSGEQVVADDAYLFNSIVDPRSQIVEGYTALMPTFFADTLDEQQINDIVEYIKSLAT